MIAQKEEKVHKNVLSYLVDHILLAAASEAQ